MSAIKVEVTLGEFGFDWEMMDEDIKELVQKRVKTEIELAVRGVARPFIDSYVEKVREHLKPRLDWLLQEALARADELPDEDLTKAMMAGLV